MQKESFQIYIEPLTKVLFEPVFSLVTFPIIWVPTLTGPLLPEISILKSKYAAATFGTLSSIVCLIL